MASSFRIFLITFLFTETLSWTIDLPEIRKYLFEKNEKINEISKKGYDEYVKSDVYFYDNKDGNSLHHKESEKEDEKYETPQYAEEYGYQTYMEKKVDGIVHKGSIYLEELRKSIERYSDFLKNCTRNNSSMSFETNSTNSTWLPRLEIPGPLNLSRWISCAEATNTSEHVRRLADLALWTTRELQDMAYTKEFQKYDVLKENELILKLAWFLDRLAHYTGYDPDPKRFTTPKPEDDYRSTEQSPTPPSYVNASEEVKNMMMNCLKRNSSEPAVERCRYPLPLPPMLEEVFNMTTSSTTESTVDTAESVLPASPPTTQTEPIADETQEILITSADRQNLSPYLKSTVKQKSVRKRSIKDPTINFFKYYVKSKVWLNSNAEDTNLEDFDVKKYLIPTKVEKRSIVGKKLTHLRLPENPMQNLGKYVQSKPTTHYNKDDQQVIELKNYLDKIHYKKVYSKVYNKKHNLFLNDKSTTLEKNYSKHVQKRSLNALKPLPIHYLVHHKWARVFKNDQKHYFDLKRYIEKLRENKFVQKLLKFQRTKRSTALTYKEMKKPGISEDPFKDISYYVKNKPTTNENPSLAQAAQARLALEQHFQTGNILVVRQYGSNYIPLVPNAFNFGLLRTLSDA